MARAGLVTPGGRTAPTAQPSAPIVTYPDSFRGSYPAAGRVDLHVDIDQAAIRDGNLTARPAFLALRTDSCPGADGAPR
jgi:hypothetical protein